jgi:adenylate cyclase
MKNIFCEGHQECEILNLILSCLEDNILYDRGFDAFLYEMLPKITLKTGEWLNADRATIFLFDEEQNELWTIVAKDENGKSREIRIPATVGIAGEVATFQQVVNIPYDFYDDPRSVNAKKFDERIGYRTYSLLAIPLLNDETGKLIAVVQLINKLKPNHQDYGTLDEQIDKVGFTQADEQIFREFAPSIRLLLEFSNYSTQQLKDNGPPGR